MSSAASSPSTPTESVDSLSRPEVSSCGSDMEGDPCLPVARDAPTVKQSEPGPICEDLPDNENTPTGLAAVIPATVAHILDPPQEVLEPNLPGQLNDPPASPAAFQPTRVSEDKDEDLSVPKSSDRSDPKNFQKDHKEFLQDGEKDFEGARRMHKFTLYETASRFYIIGSDLLDSRFRVLKIDRTAEVGDLSVIEDEAVYTREQTTRLLATIEDGNIAAGGLKQKCSFWGLLGFIRFTGPYYMILITKRSIVAMIGGHYVYQVWRTACPGAVRGAC